MNKPDMSKCPDSDLTLYHYGELPLSRAKEIEAHVAVCSSCQSTLADIKSLQSTLSSPHVEWSLVERQRFAGRVMDKLQTRKRRRFVPLFGGGLATAALAITFLALHISPVTPPKPAAGNGKMVADLEMLQDLDMLQHMDIIKNLDLLQDLGDMDERV